MTIRREGTSMTHKPIVLLHGANSSDTVRRAQSNQFQGIEIDLRATRDGVVVVRHDRRFKDGLGRNLWIDRMTFEELVRMSTVPIVRFDEFLPFIIALVKKKPNFILELDIKQPAIEEQVYGILKKHKALERIPELIISSTNVWILQTMDELDRRFKLGLTFGPTDNYDLYDLKALRYIAIVLWYTLKPLLFRLLRRKSRREGIDYANVYYRAIDARMVDFLHEQGNKVLGYNAQKKGQIEQLIKYGVDGIKIK